MSDSPASKLSKQIPAGTLLFRDGDPGAHMYVIQRGQVRIFTEVGDRQKLLAILGPGDFFGEMALLNQKARTASAEVVEDALLLEIDGQTFGQMLSANREIALRLIQKLAHRLDSANALIDLLMHRDPKARVILGLAHEAEYNGVAGANGSVMVRLEPAALAQQLALPDGEVEAVLARLYRLNIVALEADGFRIPDVLRLHEFLEFLRIRQPAE